MKKLLSVLMIMLCLTSISQVIPNKDFVVQVTQGGADIEGLASAVDFTTGAVYTCGYKNTVSTGKDLVLAKLDSNGVQLWSAIYDFASLDDKAMALCIDGSGNVYVTGSSLQAGGNSDVVTIKYNSSGAQQWVSRVNGNNNTNDVGNSILFDGTNVWVAGYVTTAGKGKDGVVLKLNGSSGATITNIKRNGSANADDVCEKICMDGTSVFVAGTTKNTTTNGDVFVACVNISASTLTWSISVNGSANGDESALDCKIDNSELYVCGYTNNTTTGDDYYFARINKSNGTINYSNIYDGGYNGSDIASSLAPDKLGGYAVTGLVTNGGNNEYHTQMYSTTALIWTHVQPLNGAYNLSYPKVAIDTIAYHTYVCGAYYNATLDGLLYQLAPSGNKMWTQYHTSPNGARDAHTNLVIDGFGRIFLNSPNETGTATNVFDYNIVRYSQTPVYLPCNYNIVTDTFSINHLYYPNSGQVVDSDYVAVNDIYYYTQFTDYSEYVQKNKVSFCKYKYDTTSVSFLDTLVRVDMVFQGGNEFSEIFPFNFQENLKLNYFTNITDSFGITNVKGASQLLVPNIYPMIDLHYSSNGKGAKYYFVVKPTGDPNNIRLFFDGAVSTNTIGGNLKINTGLSTLTFKRPDIYYVSVNLMTMAITTTTVSGTNGWVSLGGDTYSINPGTYNTSWPLVIEFDMGKSPPYTPSAIGNLDWSTYLGGSSNIDWINDVKVDNNNNLYAVGATLSTFFPNVSGSVVQPFHYGSYDGFITKFNNTTSAGVPQWATYFGGTLADHLTSLDFAPNGDIYAVGRTESLSYNYKPKPAAFNDYFKGPIDTVAGPPQVIHYHTDGYICQIVPSGDTCKWQTHCGFNTSDDSFTKCKFDPFGNFFMVGFTRSTNALYFGSANSYTRAYSNTGYVHTDNVTDGWIVKLNTTSWPTWMTTIGASATSLTSGYPPDDIITDLAFDSNGGLYIGGYTFGTNYVVAGGGSNITGSSFEGVLSRFDNNGVMQWSSHLGGTGYDKVFAIATNTAISSELYVTGVAQSGFPTTPNSGNYYYDNTHNGGTDDAFFAIYDNSNSRIHSTFLGGNDFDEGRDIEIDSYGVIHIAGKTRSTNLYTPSPNNGYNATPTGVGDWDLFVSSLSKWSNDLLWTGIIGSSKADGLEVEMTIDNSQNMLYLGASASTSTTPYPILGSSPTYTQNCSGTMDASISRFDLATIHSLVGIDEIQKLSNDVFVYPNPANEELNVKITNFKDKYNYTVYNAIGQVVRTGRLSNYENVINLIGLKTGMYFLELNNGTERLTAKFVRNE